MSQSIDGLSCPQDPGPPNPWHPFADLPLDLPSFRKESDINQPGPSQLFVFVDVYEPALLDSLFIITPPGWRQIFGTPEIWWDLPANRHIQGCNFSFADGHVEHWRWTTPKAWAANDYENYKVYTQQIAGDGDLKDFHRMQKSVRPETRFPAIYQPE